MWNKEYENSSLYLVQPQIVIINFNLWAPCLFINFHPILFLIVCAYMTPVWCTIHTIRSSFFLSSQPYHLYLWFGPSFGGPYFSWHVVTRISSRPIIEVVISFTCISNFFLDSLLCFGLGFTLCKFPVLCIIFQIGSSISQISP